MVIDRKALIVGINYYLESDSLYGCVDDAYSVKGVLERHGDGTINFDVNMLAGIGPSAIVSRAQLKDSIEELFNDDPDVALFYFAGHGYIDSTGGYLMASDSRRGDEGVSLGDILVFANNSKAKNKIIILDSCHSGIAGNPPNQSQSAVLAQGVTVLTASTKDQYATEQNGRGLFTSLLVDVLNGAAANLTGSISPGSIYAYIDESLGRWGQRPVFKTNVKTFISLRDVTPAIELSDLRSISDFFPAPGFQYKLDPSYEPEESGRLPDDPSPDPENVRKFAILQKYNRVNLVVPVDAPHMWHAAMERKSCKLTVLGEHYRQLAEKKRI